jgi:hypothetical protein
MTLFFCAVETITWIKVQKPTFNLIGVIVGALAVTGVLVLCAVVLGVLLGIITIIRRQRQAPGADEQMVRLNLSTHFPD